MPNLRNLFSRRLWNIRDLFPASRKPRSKARRRLEFDTLEDRTVPAPLDLTTAGAFGEYNDAVFEQGTFLAVYGSGNIHPFVRIQANGTEQGYNTNGTEEFDETSLPGNSTPTLLISDLPVIIGDGTIGDLGVPYLEFLLDINQSNSGGGPLSLQELQIFVGNADNLTGFPTFGGNAQLVYNMDAGDAANRVDLLASLSSGSGDGDARVLVPLSAFSSLPAGFDFVYVYSRFGVSGMEPGDASDDGFEEWSNAIVPQIDLSVTKTVNNAMPNVGSNVIFTVTVSNSDDVGIDPATGVQVLDQLPAGATFVQVVSASQGSYSSATGIWDVGELAPGATATLQIEATITVSGDITNCAQVSAADQGDVDSTPGMAVPPTPDEDDDDCVTVNGQQIDLSVTKTVDDSTPNVGSNVIFTVTVSNSNATGIDTATGVKVLDQLPAGATFVQVVSASQGSYSSATGIWDVGTLAPGASATLQIEATITVSTVITNCAQVSAADQPDVDSTPGSANPPTPNEDDDDCVDVNGQQIDLSVLKSVNDSTPNVGSNVIFTITVSNSNAAGIDQATGVKVLDQLPAGATFVQVVSASQGSYSSATGVWDVGSLAPGATATLQIEATITATDDLTNCAQVSAADQPDVDSTPGTANPPSPDQDDDQCVILTPNVIDLSVDKSVNNATPNVGSNVIFTITVSNSNAVGIDTATGVKVLDQLPAGATFVQVVSASQGSYSSATGLWDVGTLAAGASATLQIEATITTTNDITNCAQVSAADQPDVDSTPGTAVPPSPDEDDDDCVTVNGQQIDLSVNKAVNNSTPNVGTNVIFTITVTNSNAAGIDTATGVQVLDQLPAGLTFVQVVSASQGSYSAVTGIWNVGTLAPGASATLQIEATANSVGFGIPGGPPTWDNCAQVSAANQPDVDSQPGTTVPPAAPLQDDEFCVPVTPQLIDLSVIKSVNLTMVTPGQNVVFTVTVSNAVGFSTATGVQVLDQLPAGVTFVQVLSVTQGSYDPVSGVWTVGTLNSGASATLQIVATAVSIGSKVNCAQVSAANQPDKDSQPGTAVPPATPLQDDEFCVTFQIVSRPTKRRFLARRRFAF